ncbi:L,D-transpeptidase family protein [Candidatus Methylacidithermus pantelleriae]|uniref:L,D-TPase catalytic domain-containing protein n=1 Tax=Candidatus Methylacidithermus pantelleriae TaxID=2744239 RepID=A0A8J2FWC0_9BACT|nr:L,D-transpeptidase family protein [Candidatus Methylacidithermus pantelleriae]CAF0698441.1 exported hypothetical protein [Candidatus Methylacidithermus pantelleriae]
MPKKALLFLFFASVACLGDSLRSQPSPAPPSPTSSPSPLRQLVLVLAPSWDSSSAVAQRFEQDTRSREWKAVGEPFPVLLGKHGLAWGIGLHPPQPGLQKTEKDKRAPAGRFRIGILLSEDPSPPPGCRWPYYHQVTARDAWIDDPKLPFYNHLYTLPPGTKPPPWFRKERMKLHDPAYHWLLLIEHNYPNSIPGKGSAIFFHIRRGPHRPTSGCTTMAKERLNELLLWLDPAASPELVQLPSEEYLRLWQAWDLPPPSLVLPALAQIVRAPSKKESGSSTTSAWPP